MRNYLLLLFILIFSAGKLEAQQKQVHSLATELSGATSDSARIWIYCQLSGQYLVHDLQKAVEYGQKALQLANTSNHPGGEAIALNALGAAYLAIPDHKKAADAHNRALQLSARAGDTHGIIQAYTSLGNTYFKAVDHGKAIEHYLAAAGYAQQLNNKQELSKILALAGSVHENKGNYKEALNYFLKAAGTKEELGNKREWAVSLVHIGMIHIRMSQPEKALPYMLKALQLDSGPNSDTFKIDIIRNIAEAYKAMYNNQAALAYALQSYEMAELAQADTEIATSARLLQAIYADMKDFRQAYKYQAIGAEQEEILKEKSEKATLAALAAAHQAEKAELEALRQQAETGKQALEQDQTLLISTLGSLLTVAVMALLLVFFVYRRRLNATKWELQDAYQQVQARNYKIRMQHEELEQKSIAFQQQNDQLERHNHFKNKIFSIISHDLRSPFASVKGVLNLVQNKSMSEAGIKYLFGLLSKDLDVTLNMLNNLLVWSKAQLESSEITFQPVDVHRLTQENIQLAASQAKHKNIHIANMVDAGVLVLADKERVNFVLRNLLMNALKFTYEGGEILVTAKELGDTITIAVSDDGKGISEENVARLFTEERFTTIGTSSEKGTGLGLMLCKEFIESMNGRIGVESEEGIGSTFYFTLRKAAIETSGNENIQTLLQA